MFEQSICPSSCSQDRRLWSEVTVHCRGGQNKVALIDAAYRKHFPGIAVPNQTVEMSDGAKKLAAIGGGIR